ncbi:MAG: NUDIX domain-containing protein [Candidatus Moranbacteria bacterium]|nr:NUDIX domain-containing protein [Candidatus Moranbacteria bacterium]
MKKFKFKPRSGQIDFTEARWAPVINCVVRYENKILLVQRSESLNFYPGYWNGVSGFLDDRKSLKEKIKEELKEELGIPKSKIKKIQLGEIFHQEEKKYKKTWIVHPVLVDIATDEVKLDWEAKNFEWMILAKVKKMKLLPGFDMVLGKLGKWLKNKAEIRNLGRAL